MLHGSDFNDTARFIAETAKRVLSLRAEQRHEDARRIVEDLVGAGGILREFGGEQGPDAIVEGRFLRSRVIEARPRLLDELRGPLEGVAPGGVEPERSRLGRGHAAHGTPPERRADQSVRSESTSAARRRPRSAVVMMTPRTAQTTAVIQILSNGCVCL